MENREVLYIAARRYYTATSFHLFALSLNSNVRVDACTHDVCKSACLCARARCVCIHCILIRIVLPFANEHWIANVDTPCKHRRRFTWLTFYFSEDVYREWLTRVIKLTHFNVSAWRRMTFRTKVPNARNAIRSCVAIRGNNKIETI